LIFELVVVSVPVFHEQLLRSCGQDLFPILFVWLCWIEYEIRRSHSDCRRIRQFRLSLFDYRRFEFRKLQISSALHKIRAILDSSGRVRLGLSFTPASSCPKAWLIRVPELTRSDTRILVLPGTSKKVATHPVAQLKQEDSSDLTLRQGTHRSLFLRTHSFHTIYDGDGKRVKKTSSSDNTIFVYDAAGKLIEDRNSSTGALVTSYVYAGSGLLSTETSSATNYLTADHLGSPRINTDGSGNVVARHDYMPFGEEITSATTSQRSSTVNYAGDTVRQQFTGYERDSETDLDFAQARMYAKTLGRFSGADNVVYSKTQDPQTWNQFIYCRNGPLVRADPDGHNWFYINKNWVWHDGDKYEYTYSAFGLDKETLGVEVGR
jgi:RHS repeat-associated protein